MIDHYSPVVINFGCLPPLPEGWTVQYHPCLEHYIGHGPNGYETVIHVDRFAVRKWLFTEEMWVAGEQV